ncbi:hypothetical protein [Clostridium fermenticellae]|nr:hypothetical protein [Clostridium fermenticellae]
MTSYTNLIALTIILALGVIFYGGFNDGIIATVIAVTAILTCA